MKQLNLFWNICLVLGFFCIAAFSIQHDHFYSGICGVLGCILMVAGYWGLHWEEYRQGNRHMRKTLYWLIGLCILLVGLNIIGYFLNQI